MENEKIHITHGYKGFYSDMSCRDLKYEVGQTYETDDEIKPCKCGFHFCRNMADVMDYYGRKGCRYAEVEALGEVINKEDKSVTNKLRIVRELTRSEVLELMYLSEGQELKDIQFPADEIIRARETGALGEMLPSGTEFPVTFANGERNVLVVCRDREHTYLVTKYIMAEPFTMNDDWTNEGGWPACGMREHVQGIYDMLPENIRKVVIPTRIRQNVWDNECEDPAFLLSAVNVFGEKARYLENDCGDTQIDIFQKPADRVKRRLGASGASWWWLRSVYNYYCFSSVNSAGSDYACCPNSEGGVVIAFCIETRS